MIEIKDNEDFNRAFQTPESFKMNYVNIVKLYLLD